MKGRTSLAITVLLIFFVSCNVVDKDADAIISKSTRLSDLDAVCGGIPRPDGFEFSYKELSGNARVSIIGYHYKTETPFLEVWKFYSNWFEREGWVFDGPLDEEVLFTRKFFQFQKGHVTVSVERVAFAGADYSVDCSQKR